MPRIAVAIRLIHLIYGNMNRSACAAIALNLLPEVVHAFQLGIHLRASSSPATTTRSLVMKCERVRRWLHLAVRNVFDIFKSKYLHVLGNARTPHRNRTCGLFARNCPWPPADDTTNQAERESSITIYRPLRYAAKSQ